MEEETAMEMEEETEDIVAAGVSEDIRRSQMSHTRTKLKLMLLLLLPVCGFIAMSVVILVNSAQSYVQASMSQKATSRALTLASLIADLQVERGLTVIYISSGNNDLKTFKQVVHQRQRVDNNLEDLMQWIPVVIGDKTYRSKVDYVDFLLDYRRTLQYQSVTPEENIVYYTQMTQGFMASLNKDLELPASGATWRNFVAVQALLQAGDAVGIQRALGGSFFASCAMTQTNQNWYREIMANADSAMGECYMYSPDTYQRIQANLTSQHPLMDIIANKSAQIVGDAPPECKQLRVEALIDQSLYWFYNVTTYINVINDQRIRLSYHLLGELEAVIANLKNNLIVYCILVLAVGAMSSSLFWVVHQMTDSLNSFTTAIATNNINIRRKSKYVEKLLCQMVPKAIAEKIKLKAQVEGTYFEKVTICMCDLVQIKILCTESTAEQMVTLLNSLHRLYNGVTRMYNVYRIQSSGDTMMIVSGLPETNGDQHVIEIARLSQHLLNAIANFAVPHRAWDKLQLRIGVHTGSCVAGMVGSPLPRYTLTGEAVEVVAQIKAASEGCRMLVSEATKTMLENKDGFETQPAPSIIIPGRDEMPTYWMTSDWEAG